MNQISLTCVNANYYAYESKNDDSGSYFITDLYENFWVIYDCMRVWLMMIARSKQDVLRRKKNARAGHERSKMAKKLRGHKAKLYHKKRYSEKVNCGLLEKWQFFFDVFEICYYRIAFEKFDSASSFLRNVFFIEFLLKRERDQVLTYHFAELDSYASKLGHRCSEGKEIKLEKLRVMLKIGIQNIFAHQDCLQVEMRKLLRQHEEKQQTSSTERPEEGALPAYLLDRQQQASGTILSNMIKQKRKQKAVCIGFILQCISGSFIFHNVMGIYFKRGLALRINPRTERRRIRRQYNI